MAQSFADVLQKCNAKEKRAQARERQSKNQEVFQPPKVSDESWADACCDEDIAVTILQRATSSPLPTVNDTEPDTDFEDDKEEEDSQAEEEKVEIVKTNVTFNVKTAPKTILSRRVFTPKTPAPSPVDQSPTFVPVADAPIMTNIVGIDFNGQRVLATTNRAINLESIIAARLVHRLDITRFARSTDATLLHLTSSPELSGSYLEYDEIYSKLLPYVRQHHHESIDVLQAFVAIEIACPILPYHYGTYEQHNMVAMLFDSMATVFAQFLRQVQGNEQYVHNVILRLYTKIGGLHSGHPGLWLKRVQVPDVNDLTEIRKLVVFIVTMIHNLQCDANTMHLGTAVYLLRNLHQSLKIELQPLKCLVPLVSLFDWNVLGAIYRTQF
jgi:hypothetical protein